MDAMISESPDSFDREQLMSLLYEFSAIFDIGGCPLGVARKVHDSIDTGDINLLCQILHEFHHLNEKPSRSR